MLDNSDDPSIEELLEQIQSNWASDQNDECEENHISEKEPISDPFDVIRREIEEIVSADIPTQYKSKEEYADAIKSELMQQESIRDQLIYLLRRWTSPFAAEPINELVEIVRGDLKDRHHIVQSTDIEIFTNEAFMAMLAIKRERWSAQRKLVERKKWTERTIRTQLLHILYELEDTTSEYR